MIQIIPALESRNAMAHARSAEQTRAWESPPGLGVDRFAPENRRRLSAPGLRAFIAIADLWGLNEEQRRLALGFPSRSTYHNWTKAAREHRDITLDADILTRISIVLGVHQALGVLHATEVEAVTWLRSPHGAPVFGGQAPVDLIAGGAQDAMLTVRRFVDAARGGAYMAPNALDQDFKAYEPGDIVFS